MIQLTGFGGAGCNVLEYDMKQGSETEFTFVTKASMKITGNKSFKNACNQFYDFNYIKSDAIQIIMYSVESKSPKHLTI